MGLYNFKAQFVPYILDGSKTHTIRAERKHSAKVGETLHLYTGLRQKGAKLLMRVPCVKVGEIYIDGDSEYSGVVRIDGEVLYSDERDLLAWRDGFRQSFLPGDGNYFATMMQFWRGRLPFQGHIIHWDFARRLNA